MRIRDFNGQSRGWKCGREEKVDPLTAPLDVSLLSTNVM